MVFRTMRESELENWVAHCTTVFTGPTDTPEYFRDHYLDDPYHNPNGVFIAEEDGEIVSTVRVFTRELYIKGFRVTMGGIGEVSTKPAYRNRGLSGALLKMAIDYMGAEGLSISMLFTGTHAHYARYGWFTSPRRLIAPDIQSAPPLPNGAQLRPLAEADYPIARGLYGLTAGRFDGALLREHPLYWEKWMRVFWKNPIALVIDGRVCAYMDVEEDREKGTLYLNDYATELEMDWWRPMLAARAKTFDAPPRVLVPSPLLPDYAGPFAERGGTMLRLNAPFHLGDARIDTAGKLAAAMADHLFWEPDGF